MTITPIGRRIYVRPDEEYGRTKGGIIIPEAARRKTTTGIVVSIGRASSAEAGYVEDCPVVVGDHILYDMFSGSEIGLEGKDGEPDQRGRMLSFDEVLAVLS